VTQEIRLIVDVDQRVDQFNLEHACFEQLVEAFGGILG
jgi:hypothetical protein